MDTVLGLHFQFPTHMETLVQFLHFRLLIATCILYAKTCWISWDNHLFKAFLIFRKRYKERSPGGSRARERSPGGRGRDRSPVGRLRERSPFGRPRERSPYGRSRERSPGGQSRDRSLGNRAREDPYRGSSRERIRERDGSGMRPRDRADRRSPSGWNRGRPADRRRSRSPRLVSKKFDQIAVLWTIHNCQLSFINSVLKEEWGQGLSTYF